LNPNGETQRERERERGILTFGTCVCVRSVAVNVDLSDRVRKFKVTVFETRERDPQPQASRK
jgi:hypothetical protein